MTNLNTKLLFGGPQTPNELLNTWISSLKHPQLVEAIGMVDPEELKTVYARSTVVVLTSMEEGMPNVGVEAMASDCLVIGVAVREEPELIDNLDSGLIFPPRDTSALAHCLLETAGSSEKVLEMGDRSRIKVEHDFDTTNFGPAYYKFYESTCVA